MSNNSKNTGFFRIFEKLHDMIAKSNLFGNKANKLLFKPENEVTITPSKSKMRIVETEKHYHRSNTHPLAEKQSLLKNKKKAKGSY